MRTHNNGVVRYLAPCGRSEAHAGRSTGENMEIDQHQFEIDIGKGEFQHLDTPALYAYLAKINASARGSNPAYHATMNHAGETIRFLIKQREDGAQQARVLKWTQVAAIAAIVAAIIGIVSIVLQFWE